MTKLLPIFLVCLFGLSNCTDNNKREIARQKAEQLLIEIQEGTAVKEFPDKYDKSKVEAGMNQLRDACEFKNRKGQFVNDWYESKGGGVDRVSLIYEYYLKCDSLRLVFTYDLGDSVTLSDFLIQKLREENAMIIDKDRQLKY